MLGRSRRLALVALAGSCVLAITACGGGGSSSHSASGAADRVFPVFKVALDTGLDSLDPGLSYTVEGRQILWNVYLPLLGYRHVSGTDGATIVPYLAASLPTISADGKTYRLTLRKGLEYSDGTPVKASDFAATIERDLKMGSPGAGFFTDIVGASQFQETTSGHIKGISTDDKSGGITIRLRVPRSDFMNILAMEFAAPVPAGAPTRDMSTTPLPSTGPYRIERYEPGKQIVLVRNPNFDASRLGRNVPSGNPSRVRFDVVADDAVALRRVLSGKDDWDQHQLPTDQQGAIQLKYSHQVKQFTPANTYYFFMNTRVPPFDNLKVRQAVNYAINRDALVRIYGGLAQATENILPPAYPSFAQHKLYPYDIAKATQLIRTSGYAGSDVTVWSQDPSAAPKASSYLVDVLNMIGLVAHEKSVPSNVYWRTIGDQATKAQIGVANWFQDYPNPLDWFDVLLNGERITETTNNNYANYDNPTVDARIAALKREPKLTSKVNQQWAALDERVMRDAPWAPFINRTELDFFNANVDLHCYLSHVLYGFDYATICMKS